MKFYYDALDSDCKNPIGAIYEEDELKIEVKSSDVKKCRLILRYDGQFDCFYDMAKSESGFSIVLKNLRVGLIWYSFDVDGERFADNGLCRAEIKAEKDFQLSVCKKRNKLKGFDNAIMYQIMPDRFAKAENFGVENGRYMRKWGEIPEYLPDENGKILNNDFFGGNFEGIRRKLPYLKSLGINKMYLNPIFKANSNHRYDTGDYLTLDPLLGSESDFYNLVSDAQKYDICIILDGVFNHTGDDSLYFNKYNRYHSVGAYQSKNSRYFDWYIFEDFPNKYKSWWGIDTLPTINKNSKDYENFIVGRNGVLEKYLKLGIGGFRLDVVDEIPDEFVKQIYSEVKLFGDDKIVIGEVWEDASNKIAYDTRRTYFTELELDGVMNYPLKNAIINFVITGNGKELYSVIRNQINNYTQQSLSSMMNILGTHDTPRILTVLGKSGIVADTREAMANEKLTLEEIELGIKRLKCASLLQFTLYGFPCIYYGDEIGMEGNRDPFNRKCFDFEKRNKSIFEWYQKLTAIRREVSCFGNGAIKRIGYFDGIISFERVDNSGVALVVVNCGQRVADINLKNNEIEITRNIKTDKITLSIYDYAIFYKINNEA